MKHTQSHDVDLDTFANATLPLMKWFKPCGKAFKSATECKREREESDEVKAKMKMVLLSVFVCCFLYRDV